MLPVQREFLARFRRANWEEEPPLPVQPAEDEEVAESIGKRRSRRSRNAPSAYVPSFVSKHRRRAQAQGLQPCSSCAKCPCFAWSLRLCKEENVLKRHRCLSLHPPHPGSLHCASAELGGRCRLDRARGVHCWLQPGLGRPHDETGGGAGHAARTLTWSPSRASWRGQISRQSCRRSSQSPRPGASPVRRRPSGWSTGPSSGGRLAALTQPCPSPCCLARTSAKGQPLCMRWPRPSFTRACFGGRESAWLLVCRN